MGGLFSSNEHAENIRKAKEKFEQQQFILEANMLVNKLRRDGLSTDFIAGQIIMNFPKYVIPHINDKDVQAQVEKDHAELWIHHW